MGWTLPYAHYVSVLLITISGCSGALAGAAASSFLPALRFFARDFACVGCPVCREHPDQCTDFRLFENRTRTLGLKQREAEPVSEVIMEQDIHSDGSSQMECILLYNFLQSSSNCEFRDQLQVLQGQWILPAAEHVCHYDDDGDLQTDGNRSGHLQNGELALASEGMRNEEIFRIIGAQLAEIGDQLDKEIQARVVNDLVQHFLNENLSREEITRCLSQAVEGLARAIPSDMEQEKALLVLAMVLTKKVANRVPSLLQRIFSTTVNYINQHLHTYVVRMLRE